MYNYDHIYGNNNLNNIYGNNNANGVQVNISNLLDENSL